MTLDQFIITIPSIVFLLYSATAIAWAIKGDYCWALVWGSYALANIGMILIGMRT
jgi:hypothetical protein